VGRYDLLDYNTVKGNEALLDGYWILSLTPSWFLDHLAKSFQVKKLNNVDHPPKIFIIIYIIMLPKNAPKYIQISFQTQLILIRFSQPCDRLQGDKIQGQKH
jgi:hypothetical protein